jgi:hypothetical protein
MQIALISPAIPIAGLAPPPRPPGHRFCLVAAALAILIALAVTPTSCPASEPAHADRC